VHYIRPFLACDEIAGLVLWQAGVYLGTDFREFALGVELLAVPDGRACGTLAEILLLRRRLWWPFE
jgi:hypothetical protein